MPIDDCRHTFRHLSSTRLPGYLKKLGLAMRKPHPLALFAEKGVGPDALARSLGHEDGDFAGCYVILRGQRPIYVGISRGVMKRLRDHVRGTTDSTATLAYRMALDPRSEGRTRAQNMSDGAFMRRFERGKQDLERRSVAFIPIENAVELHLFEVYAAMELDTSPLNTFETH